MAEPEYLRSTRVSYDLLADHVADAWRDELDHKPHDRAMLSAFADVVRAAGGGLVTDAGCGAGRITGWLHKAGLDVEGTDLSPGMLGPGSLPGTRSSTCRASGSRTSSTGSVGSCGRAGLELLPE